MNTPVREGLPELPEPVNFDSQHSYFTAAQRHQFREEGIAAALSAREGAGRDLR